MSGEGDNPNDAYLNGLDVDLSEFNRTIDNRNTYEWARPVSKVWERTALSKALSEYVSRQKSAGQSVTVRSEAQHNMRELKLNSTGMRLLYVFKDRHLKKTGRVFREETVFKVPPDIKDCMDQITAFPHNYESVTGVCELDSYSKEDVEDKLHTIEDMINRPETARKV